MESVPSGSAFELVGIGTSAGAQGAQRTAVISATGSVFLVRAGDTLLGRYQVVRVEEDSVVLVKDTGEELVLRLK